MKKSIIILLSFVLFSFQNLYAQKYGSALGIRGDKSKIGLSYVHRIFPKITLEGIGQFNKDLYVFTGITKVHKPILFKSFNTYVGLGGHVGHFDETGIYGGFDIIVGVEYKFPLFPLILSADFKPATHLNYPDSFELGWGVSARFVLVSHKQIKKRQKQKEKAKRLKQKAKSKDGEKSKGILNWFKKEEELSKREARKKRRQDKKNPPPPSNNPTLKDRWKSFWNKFEKDNNE